MLIRNSAPPESEQIPKQEKFIPSIKPSVRQLPALPSHRQPVVRRINLPRIHLPKMQIPPQLPSSTQGRINLGKVAQLLRDPSVLSVECTGPGKHLLVNRAGVIQTTPVTLTKEEIDQILGEISVQTQIPIVPGIFKALLKNILLTAVVSDYVGTRFIIQKRMPF